MAPSSTPPQNDQDSEEGSDRPLNELVAERDWSLTERVYAELRRMAEIKLQRAPGSSSLQATMLVNEVWLRLRETPAFEEKDPGHYIAAAVQAMRWVVVDQARKRKAARLDTLAGGQLEDPSAGEDDRILALNEAMERLKGVYPTEARVAELRYFTGLSIEETAQAVGASPATVKRRWAFARAWLTNELGPEALGDS